MAHTKPLLEMHPNPSFAATESWADAPSQAKPKSLSVTEINEATAPKTVPQGGFKDCCE